MIHSIFIYVLYASLYGTAVAGIILLLKLVFKKSLSAQWHYFIWII